MSEFILINLNQTVNRALQVELQRERWRWALFGLFTIIFCGIGFGYYTFHSELTLLINNREERIQTVKNQIDSLKENVGIDLSKSDIETFYNFENKHILWADKLKVLSEITPDYMAITEIDYRKDKKIKRDRVTISAVSRIVSDEKDFTVIEEFINLLKSNEIFSKDFINIRFVNSDRFVSRGQEILAFKIEASRTIIDPKKTVKVKKGL
ncbi:MAG: hypothetical protein HQ510_10100 [Candidatus Marinimicrobia bacterium]|nr:hypothetical protein [Candidatus Neomarinimicrobiota bacterium]